MKTNLTKIFTTIITTAVLAVGVSYVSASGVGGATPQPTITNAPLHTGVNNQSKQGGIQSIENLVSPISFFKKAVFLPGSNGSLRIGSPNTVGTPEFPVGSAGATAQTINTVLFNQSYTEPLIVDLFGRSSEPIAKYINTGGQCTVATRWTANSSGFHFKTNNGADDANIIARQLQLTGGSNDRPSQNSILVSDALGNARWAKATIENGQVVFSSGASSIGGQCVQTAILGCTNALALNYNSLATVNDNSCRFGIWKEGGFGACNSNGEKTQTVTCIDPQTNTVVNDKHCITQKPATTQSCTVYSWQEIGFSNECKIPNLTDDWKNMYDARGTEVLSSIPAGNASQSIGSSCLILAQADLVEKRLAPNYNSAAALLAASATGTQDALFECRDDKGVKVSNTLCSTPKPQKTQSCTDYSQLFRVQVSNYDSQGNFKDYSYSNGNCSFITDYVSTAFKNNIAQTGIPLKAVSTNTNVFGLTLSKCAIQPVDYRTSGAQAVVLCGGGALVTTGGGGNVVGTGPVQGKGLRQQFRIVDTSIIQATYSWIANNWSTCTVNPTGTGGTRTRTYSCQNDTTKQIVADSNCKDSKPDPDIGSCTPPPSTITYSWQWDTTWGTCTNGTQTKNYTCKGSDNTIDTTGSKCTTAKPNETQSCGSGSSNSSYPAYAWEMTGWAPNSCSGPTGSQTRSVTCHAVSPQGKSLGTVADSNCSQPKPKVSNTCTNPNWRIGIWSTTCQNSTNERVVECKSSGSIVADNNCTDLKPKDTKTCSESGAYWFHNNTWFSRVY